jgi:glyoxylase-like metal-dependent hydrolase (beta-lactamase superfamily II)
MGKYWLLSNNCFSFSGLLLSGLLLLVQFTSNANPKDYLKNCYDKQVKPLNNFYLCVSYKENRNELGHDFEPWKQTNYTTRGTIWCNAGDFLKNDTLTRGNDSYYSKTHLDKSTLLFRDYGDENLSPVTAGMFSGYLFETARYSPIMLIDYFALQKPSAENESDTAFAIYKLIINKAVVRLYIRKKNNLMEKAVILMNDDMLGDVTSTYMYKEYSETGGVHFPCAVDIEKINGRLHDEIRITAGTLMTRAPVLINKPVDYSLDETEVKQDVTTEKYNDNIYFINLKHTESKSVLVVFKDFLLAIEAPLSSANGELIISEARKIAPGKPVKYFAFSHHHPWYLGGMRPFVHIGATILTVKDDIPYLEYLASAEHSLQPDSQQLQPAPLKTDETGMNKTITDGDYKMEIYFIGGKSAHTNDYLLFYFPSEKLLVEGDLVWIPQNGEIKKAGKRQAGLYNAIKELGIEVETIIQEWPISDKYGVKSVIPFSELEQSVNVK